MFCEVCLVQCDSSVGLQLTADIEEFSGEVIKFAVIFCIQERGSLTALNMEP